MTDLGPIRLLMPPVDDGWDSCTYFFGAAYGNILTLAFAFLVRRRGEGAGVAQSHKRTVTVDPH